MEQGPIKDFHRVDTSYAWNYHKGCRLQWLDKNRMIYNTAIANRLVSKIHDLSTGEYQVIDCPIDAVHQTVKAYVNPTYFDSPIAWSHQKKKA